MDYKIKFFGDDFDRWQYSMNGGGTWTPLKANNPNDPSEAIYEASQDTGNTKWNLID